MKYYLIAGERSGDLHASNLIAALKKEDSDAHFRALGGEMMEAVGAEIYRYYHEINYMGVWEVIKKLNIILKNLKACKADILAHRPDVLILVDFGGFNMKIAKFAKENNLKTFYYISPKVWAWNTGRAYNIKKYVDRMFVILPFEKQFFKQFDYEVDYVGNPVNDSISSFVPDPKMESSFRELGKPIVAILPGSRNYEVDNMFSVVGEVIQHYPDVTFVVAAVDNLPKQHYENFKIQYPEVVIVYENTYNILVNAKAAIVTSGTASLETALLEIPHMVVFKANLISYLVAKSVLKIKYVSLPNLIAGYEVVKELLQYQFTAKAVSKHLKELMNDNEVRAIQLEGYSKIKTILGSPGTADKTAKLIFHYISQPS